MKIEYLVELCGGDLNRAVRAVAHANYINRISVKHFRKPIPTHNFRGQKVDVEATKKVRASHLKFAEFLSDMRAELVKMGATSKVGSALMGERKELLAANQLLESINEV